LSDGDPLKFEAASELNFIFALSMKSFEMSYPQVVKHVKNRL